MKSTAMILTVGLLAGAVAHFGWYSARHQSRPQSLDAQLSWMRESLELNGEQYQRIRSLHERLSPQLAALAEEVGRMRQQLAAFELQRVTTEEIDFLEFAQFVEAQRSVDRACTESTRHLIEASAEEMTPTQRKLYMAMLAPALTPPAGTTYH